MVIKSDYSSHIASISDGFNKLDLTKIPYKDKEELFASIRELDGIIWRLVDFVEKIDKESGEKELKKLQQASGIIKNMIEESEEDSPMRIWPKLFKQI